MLFVEMGDVELVVVMTVTVTVCVVFKVVGGVCDRMGECGCISELLLRL